MWNVPCKVMCRQHLLGEHLEMHMFAGAIMTGKKIDGYITNGLVDTRLIFHRHQKIVMEMYRRGYKHKSPFNIETLVKLIRLRFEGQGEVNVMKNLGVLRERCPECRKLIIEGDKRVLEVLGIRNSGV